MKLCNWKFSKKGNMNAYNRLMALLLCVVMLVSHIPISGVYASEEPDYSVTTNIDLGTYSSDLYLYNHTNYNTPAGEFGVTTNRYGLIGTNTNADISIKIGDNPVEGKENTNPNGHNINTCLKGLSLAGDIIISAVSAGMGDYYVHMGVSDTASTVSGLVLESNSKLTLDVRANLTVGTLTLNSGSVLTVNVAEGAALSVAAVNGSSGSMIVNSGSGTLSLSTANVGSLNATGANIQIESSLHVSNDLSLSDTVLSGSDSNAKVTADGNITVSGGEIKTLSLFGYADGVTGEKNVTFSGGSKLDGVSVLGVTENGTARVSLLGIDTVNSVSSTNFVSDFSIRYYHAGEEKTYTDVDGYRAVYSGKAKNIQRIVGTLNSSGVLNAGSTVLPEYVQAGYTFSGWHINNSESYYRNLAESDTPVITVAENLDLTTAVIAEKVAVIFDHGFVPDAYSHVCPKPDTETSSDKREWYLNGDDITVGAAIDVSGHPTRFGYKFTGWKITTGSAATTISAETKNYTVAYDDLTDNGTLKELRIEACWEAEEYPLRLSLAASMVNVPLNNTEISFNGTDWYSMDTASSSYISTHPDYGTKFTWDAADHYFRFTNDITYGDSIEKYLSDLGSDNITMLPILRDTREAAIAKAFSAWITTGGKVITEDLVFSYSLYGMLDSRGDGETLDQFATQLQENPTTLGAAWGGMQFDLNITKQTGWDVLINGTVIEPPTGTQYELQVVSGTTVTLRTSAANASAASLWNVKANGNKIYMTEQPYKAGDQYLTYTFTMPKKTVSAIYNADISANNSYFDIYESPITFAENVSYNGLNRNGFWYNYKSDDMPYTPLFAKVGTEYVAMSALTGTETVSDYFYGWNNSNFYVTSNNKATQNQLTVANKITVYLKNCNLIARDEYTGKVAGWNTKIADNVFLNENMTSCANIILSTEFHAAYVTDLKIDGDSTINCIAMSKYEISSEHKTQLNIAGINTRDQLVLDSILITHQPKLENLQITAPSGTNNLTWFIYGRATIADYNDTMIKNCEIRMPGKNVDLNMGEIKFQQGTVAEFNTIKYYGDFALSGENTFVHIHGDVIGNYNTISLSNNASLVVEGSVKRSWVHATAKGIIDTDGYLVVKGNLLEFSRLEVHKGTIVANVISVGSKFDIDGGTVVANMITNKPYKGGSGNEANVYDTFPFATYSQTDTSEQAWSIYGDAKVYLFGYYKTSSDGVFDTTVRADADKNPIKALIEDMLEEDKTLNTDLPQAIETYAAQSKTESAVRETFALGNSGYTKGINTDGRIRSVKIYGNAELYAAGNVTFYNETSIYGDAKITVYGTLGSRRDMTISGTPTISAECIAGGGDLTYRDSNGNSRWAEIILQGGTIKVDSLGAVNDKRNTLVVEDVGDSLTVMPWESSTVTVVQDVCINYIYGSDFTVADNQKLDNARFRGEWANGFPTTMTGAKTFSTVTAAADNTVSKWRYGSLEGEVVQGISDDGMLAGKKAFLASRETGNAYEYIDLYAVKDRYTLTVKKLDSEKEAFYDGTALNQGDEMSLIAGQNYTLTLESAEDINKTVLWYQDPNGNLHNVPLTKGEVSGALTFKMPASNVELYITETLPLDLSSYSLAFFDDGFMAELTKSRNDSYFEYNGSYFITQPEETETVNLISVRENLAAGQTMTIHGLNQKIREQYGIDFYNDVKAELIVDGDNTVSFIHIPETATVTIKGKTGNDTDKLRVHIYTDKNESVGAERSSIGSVDAEAKAKAGTITIKDLHLVKKDKSARMFSSVVLTSNLLTLENVVFNDKETGDSDEGHSYNTGSFAVCFQDIMIKNCDLLFKGDKGYQPVIFNSCKNVTIDSSVVTQNDFGSANSNGAILFATITGEVKIIGNSDVRITRENTAAKVFHEYLYKKDSYPAAVYVEDTAKLIVEGRLALFGDPTNENKKGLVVSDSAVVEVTNTDTTDSYLLCNELTVSDSATVKADYVILSAFTWPSAPTVNGTAIKGEKPLFETWASQASNDDRIETGVLTQTGGTINASKFIGGAYGADLNISGGVLNSSAIGTMDAIFGYATLIPSVDQEQVYRYTINAFNCESTVNITDGTVNISENGYLGGHNSALSISGGKVKLGANATMGMTDDQLTDAQNDATANGKTPADEIEVSVMITGGKVEGENALILVPYGTVQISGASTAVKARKLMADYGSISILDACGTYEPVTTYEKHNAGVFVSEYLSAQGISIKNGAVVYAKVIEAIIPEGASFGGLVLEKESEAENGGILYADSYGVKGEGATDESLSKDGSSTIYCYVQVVPITYHLNDDEYDKASNDGNPVSYNQETGTYLALADPIRHGFDFGGWYIDAAMTEENKVSAQGLYKGNTDPVVLYAKWIPKEVTFKITIYGNTHNIDLSAVKDQLEPDTLDEINNTFTFTETFKVAYRTRIQGGTGIHLSNIKLPMWQTLALDYLDADGNPVQVEATDVNTTIVDKYIFDKAEADDTFELRISAIQKTRQLVYFHLSNTANFVPKDVMFTCGETDYSTSTSVSSYVDFGSAIGNGKGFIKDNAFISASALGYKSGWSWVKSDGTAVPNLENTVFANGVDTHYYADWQAKTYTVEFDATVDDAGSAASNITASGEPAGTESAALTGTVEYDQKLDGNLVFESLDTNNLPLAWTEGHVFSHWIVNGKKVTKQSELNLSTFSNSLDETKGDTAEVAMKITAVYSKVKVTYVTDGGTWKTDTFGGTVGKTNTAVHTATFGQPLAGLLTDGSIHSTSADGFDGTYDEGDYRHVIMRKGYTFQGWFDGDVEYKSTPKYQDITVKAKWEANSYTLVLNPKKEGEGAPAYDGLQFVNNVSAGEQPPEVTVKVSEVLKNGENVDVTDWPERAENTENWYVWNTDSAGDDSKRFLLGFTFGALDPGNTESSTYVQYGADVTTLINDKTMLEKGSSTFFIPDSYHAGGLNEVVDYPAGSKIQMYAIYRERSLVFLQHYLNPDTGVVEQTEMKALPYRKYSTYPTELAPNGYEGSASKAAVEAKGYKLLGWYFHDAKAVDGNKYPDNEADYLSFVDSYIGSGSVGGSYDIRVYTVFVPTVIETGKILKGDGRSTDRETANYADYLEYTIPGSMQEGQMTFSIKAADGTSDFNELEFVPYGSIDYYDAGTANNKVAVKVMLSSPDNSKTYTLSLSETDSFGINQKVAAGWTLRLELYTAYVVSEEKDYTFDLTFGFADERLKEQKIVFDDMKISMVPSRYQVEFDAKLPEDSALELLSDNGFSVGNQTQTITVNYGGDLIGTPVLEGYTSAGWYEPSDSTKKYTKLNMPVSESNKGIVKLQTAWTVNEYLLDVNSTLLDYWNVTYTPVGGSPTAYNSADKKIPYHSVVEFTPKAVDDYYLYKEFVSLTMKEPGTSTVSENTNLLLKGTPFTMEAKDVYAEFADERTLYLETDNITVNPENYVHNGDTVTWHGKYIIRMNSSNSAESGTANVLAFNGDLANRSIKLGNLKINSDHSIALSNDAVVTLNLESSATTVAAKNILAPSGSVLTVNGSEGKVQVAPNKNIAGIGDANGNGSITLNNLQADLTLPISSDASGIGSSAAAATGDAIVLDKCTVSVYQEPSALGTFNGVWIGGQKVSKVSFRNGSVLTQKDGSAKPGTSYAFDGTEVVINGSAVTADATVHAREKLGITNSTISQTISTQVMRPPVGTDSAGTTTVTNSSVTVDVAAGGYWTDNTTILYSGKLVITDAVSDVTVNGAQLVEVGNGNITIADNSYTQNGQTHDHNGRYVLLGNGAVSTSTLTTNKNDALIALDAQSADVELASIAFTGNPTFEGATGKKLIVSGDFSGTGNLTLEDITVETAGKVGSLGNTDSTASTVSVTGNSSITASTFGALGAQNDTFTFVELSSGTTVNGKLVQDHYRIKYVVDDDYGAGALPSVFRTETNAAVQSPVGGCAVPGAPSGNSSHRTWYYRADGNLYAVSSADAALAGFYDNAELTADLAAVNVDKETNSDGTVSVFLYADRKVEGNVALSDGRLFEDFTGSNSVEIPANGAFTAKLTATGAGIFGSDYTFVFTNALPEDVKLTLTALNGSGASEYYYYITAGSENTIKISDFIKMGTLDSKADIPSDSSMSPSHTDTLLLAVDFSDAGLINPVTNTVTFNFVNGNYTQQIGNECTYNLEGISNGIVETTGDGKNEGTVKVTTPTVSIYSGKAYQLVAEFDKALPYGAAVVMGSNAVTRIDSKTFVFDAVPTTQTNYTVSGVYGNYTVTWKLVLMENDNNSLGTVLASAAALSFSNPKSVPSLTLAVKTVDGSTANAYKHTLEVGKAHSVVFDITADAGASVSAKAQVQSGALADFRDFTNVDCAINGNSLTVNIPANIDKGVYRVAVSLNGNSWDDCDNVYYSFVIN